jgi:alpha-tubulin suppressor-like RCC1 family protein
VVAGLLIVAPGWASAQTPRFTALAAGNRHTCALDDHGTVWCWGANDLGQLGRGTDDAVAHPEPAPVKSDSSFTYIAARSEHTCALTRSGGVRCWGAVVGPYLLPNQNTSLLYGMDSWSVCQTGFKCNPTPAPIRGGTRYTRLAVGFGHVCGIETNQSVSCWGWNLRGQAGPIQGVGMESPKRPIVVAEYVAVATGSNHSCALRDDGAVQCWGSNRWGQLGPWRSPRDKEPRPVPLPGPATALAAGDDFNCVIANGVSAYCWGNPGDGDSMSAATPRQVPGAFLQLTAGGRHACALAVGGTVYCWGGNELQQAGDSTGRARVDPPFRVRLPGRATVLTAGGAHTCALLEDGSTYCWGEGLSGQLGAPALATTAVPVRVGTAPPAEGRP